MFLKKLTTSFTESYSARIERLKTELARADGVLIGAGAGLSTSAGLSYAGERFETNFADFITKYHYHDMYSAGFYPYACPEEYWAYWSRHIFLNRYDQPSRQTYQDLLRLVQGKDYFVLTTNVDHCFQQAGFEKQRLFYTQGDYGLWQCVDGCRSKTYDNEAAVRQMVQQQRNLLIPTELIPVCPLCGKPMTMNLRSDNDFVEDDGWHAASVRYEQFLQHHGESHILYLELGVGGNTPGIIKYPFWKMTQKNPKATYACINLGEAIAPHEIESQSIFIDNDIGKVLSNLL